MNFDKLAYPEEYRIGEQILKGRRDIQKGEVNIPYKDEPDIGIGDIFTQKSGSREIFLKILDIQFLPGGTLNVGTNLPHMLTLKVENTTALPFKEKHNMSTFNIGSVSGEQIQVGNQNTQVTNINLQQLTEHIAKSNDENAKGMLKSLFNNSTVAGLLGAGASALLGLL